MFDLCDPFFVVVFEKKSARSVVVFEPAAERSFSLEISNPLFACYPMRLLVRPMPAAVESNSSCVTN